MSTGLSPQFPLALSEYGDFANNINIKDLVKQNFKNLLLTIPGERIMLPDFGVGLSTYLFEFRSGINSPIANLKSKIQLQVKKYLPYIDLLDVQTVLSEENDFLSLRIIYYIKPLSITDAIELS